MTREREEDMAKYNREVMDDYINQYGNEMMLKEGDTPLGIEFINFLLLRMYYEGLPAKEPPL